MTTPTDDNFQITKEDSRKLYYYKTHIFELSIPYWYSEHKSEKHKNTKVLVLSLLLICYYYYLLLQLPTYWYSEYKKHKEAPKGRENRIRQQVFCSEYDRYVQNTTTDLFRISNIQNKNRPTNTM